MLKYLDHDELDMWYDITVVRLMKPTAAGFIRYGRRRSDRIGTARFVWKVGHLQSWFFAYTEILVLGTTCINHVDYFASAAEILARENRGWWSQLYFGIRVGWSQLSTGMKPTDSRTGPMEPTADNSVALKGALGTDYACNGWIWAIGTCKHKFSDQLGLHLWVCRRIYCRVRGLLPIGSPSLLIQGLSRQAGAQDIDCLLFN